MHDFQIIKPPDLPFLRAITEPGQCAKFDEYVVEPEKLFALESDGEVVGWMHLHIPGEAKYSAFIYLYRCA